MKLHYKKLGEGKPLLILHGLMGMLDNWQSHAKTFAESHSVYLIDQRNHGKSPHSDLMSYDLMMSDLLEFVEDQDFDKVSVIGHSMGGKVAMKFAQNFPEYIDKLLIVDIAPKFYPVHHDLILQALHSVELKKINRRKEAEEMLSIYLHDYGVIQFLLKNLYWKEKGQMAWRFNLDSISKNIEKMGEEIMDHPYFKEVLFIYGEKSDYIKEDEIEDIKTPFPQAKFEKISNAGHWVHADNPKAFMDTCLKHLA